MSTKNTIEVAIAEDCSKGEVRSNGSAQKNHGTNSDPGSAVESCPLCKSLSGERGNPYFLHDNFNISAAIYKKGRAE